MANVSIIGAVFIGRAWVIAFARAGHAVTLWDEDGAAPHERRAHCEIGKWPEADVFSLTMGLASA